MKTKESLKSEETTLTQEELTDLSVDDKELATEIKGGAIAGIVIAATSDNNRNA